jgi:prepilin peptidase CpaA
MLNLFILLLTFEFIPPINGATSKLLAQGDLLLPLLLSLGMAWKDARTHRIPNYLTLGGVLAGLGFQVGSQGWGGLVTGLEGAGLGFILLFLPYLKGGIGAGDVKALSALGAWLGAMRTFYLFIYMGISGGVIILGVLWWRGLLWSSFRQGWVALLNWLLCRGHGPGPHLTPTSKSQEIPYGPALALGMALLCWRGP